MMQISLWFRCFTDIKSALCLKLSFCTSHEVRTGVNLCLSSKFNGYPFFTLCIKYAPIVSLPVFPHVTVAHLRRPLCCSTNVINEVG